MRRGKCTKNRSLHDKTFVLVMGLPFRQPARPPYCFIYACVRAHKFVVFATSKRKEKLLPNQKFAEATNCAHHCVVLRYVGVRDERALIVPKGHPRVLRRTAVALRYCCRCTTLMTTIGNNFSLMEHFSAKKKTKDKKLSECKAAKGAGVRSIKF